MLRFWLIILSIVAINVQAGQCLKQENLQRLDQQYEEALRVGNTKFLDQLLADEFVWVHNLEADIENKPALLKRLKDQTEIPTTRFSHDVSVHRMGKTAVLSGLSSVEKNNADDQGTRASRYRFMRTYVAQGRKCYLLAVQTMKVWSSEANQ